jgi:hypothetical protein
MTRALFALSLLALPTASLGAQVSADFTPRIGVYVPLKDLIVGTDAATGLPARAKAQTKLTIGGRLGLWMSPSFGFEGVVDYNKGGVTTYLSGTPVFPTASSHFFAGTGRAMLKLHTASGGVALILNAGAGLVDRGGEFIAGGSPPASTLIGRTDFAPAAGIAFLVRLRSDVAARIDVDGYTYKARYFSPISGSTGEQRQYDLVITFGLTGPFKKYGIPGE